MRRENGIIARALELQTVNSLCDAENLFIAKRLVNLLTCCAALGWMQPCMFANRGTYSAFAFDFETEQAQHRHHCN